MKLHFATNNEQKLIVLKLRKTNFLQNFKKMKPNTIIGIATACFITISSLIACTRSQDTKVMGYAPIYLPQNQVYIVDVLSPRSTETAGKIYQYGQGLTLQVDVSKGIHVINASIPTSPQKVKFISIPGVSEIAVRNNILIANNFNDLVSIDISNLNAIQLVGRTKDVYQANQGTIPTEPNAFFECPDEKKGVVIGWEKKELVNPKCKTL
jgi:hypothetical protein